MGEWSLATRHHGAELLSEALRGVRMGDRRPTRGLNPRVREAVGAHGPAQWDNGELIRLMESGDISRETTERIAQLLGQVDPWTDPELSD